MHRYQQVVQNGGPLITNRLTIRPTTSGFQAEWRNLCDVNEKIVQGETVIALQTKALIVRLGKRQIYLACTRCDKKLIDLKCVLL